MTLQPGHTNAAHSVICAANCCRKKATERLVSNNGRIELRVCADHARTYLKMSYHRKDG